MPFHFRLNHLWASIKHVLLGHSRVWFTASGVTGGVIVCRLVGVWQPLELHVYDQWVRSRPLEPRDERVVIVGIDEADISQIGKWPIPDETLAQLIRQLQAYKPRVIGMNIYRDLPVEPGHQELLELYRTTPNLIGIEQMKDQSSLGVAPPPYLKQKQQIGFNNTLLDTDGTVRRGLLYWTVDQQVHESFSLKLARMYLAQDGITQQASRRNPLDLQLGAAIFQRLQSTDGGYSRIDTAGYQFLARFQGPVNTVRIVPLRAVLSRSVPPQVFRDRLVMIGSTATSLKDFFNTAHSQDPLGHSKPQPLSGVELQAQFASQLVSAALDERQLVQIWSEPVEWLWIWLWACGGAIVCWRRRSPVEWTLSVVGGLLGLLSITYGLWLWQVMWIPVVPAAIAGIGAAGMIMVYIARQEEELQRSREFLSTLLNTIPDPIFVKDAQHRWIILNEAYCQFSGYARTELLGNSEENLLPPHQVAVFAEHERQAFDSAVSLESEEDFTDKLGVVHRIATKRSRHRDAAGNTFLVGIIHDITARKRIEEDLKRSNQELRESAHRLHHLVNHDVLTGLPNRKLFYERLEQAVAQAEHHQHLVALLFVDLDGFKQINDTFGHGVGDLLLQAVGKRMTGCLRSSDTVSRLGGDEFTVILPNITTADVAEKVASKLLITLTKPFALQEYNIVITISIGISLYPIHAQDLELVVQGADVAMYMAKQAGKNQYKVYNATDDFTGYSATDNEMEKIRRHGDRTLKKIASQVEAKSEFEST
jgi:diguanylate cyclase (GGDEF)-like protein/PAS domain S-box-containing protein